MHWRTVPWTMRHWTMVDDRNPWQAEEGEGDINNNGNNKHIKECVRGLRWVDTKDGQWQCSWHDGCNNDKDEEGGSHPIPWMMATHKLAARLHFAGRDRRWTEVGEGNIVDSGNNKHVDGHAQGLRWADTGDRQWQRSQRYGNSDNKDEEGGLHPTPGTTVACKLAARLRSTGILYVSTDDNDDKQWTTR